MSDPCSICSKTDCAVDAGQKRMDEIRKKEKEAEEKKKKEEEEKKKK